MMDYDVRVELVEQACALTPGLESPTVSPLHDKGWVAVRAMVPRAAHQPGHGRAVRARRPRHPGHRHPRLPAVMSASRSGLRPHARTRMPCSARVADARSRIGVAVAALVIFTVGAISLPQGDPLFGGWSVVDRLMLVLIGVAIAALMWRYASIRAVPTREGLVVRNLFTTRRLAWAADRPRAVRRRRAVGHPRPRRHRHRGGHGDPEGRRQLQPGRGRSAVRPRAGPRGAPRSLADPLIDTCADPR